MIKKTFSCLTMLFLVLACSTMEIHVTSEPPQANVYLKDGKKLKKIGETPLKIDPSLVASSSNFHLHIQKEGFQPQDVLIEKRSMGATAEIFASLPKIENNNIVDQSVDQEKIQRSLSTIQTELIKKDYGQAETLARSFLSKNPYSAVGWNLLGNAYVLQNRNAQALKAYQRAIEYDPYNKDTQKMIQFLETNPGKRGE